MITKEQLIAKPFTNEDAQQVYDAWQESRYNCDSNCYEYEKLPENILILYDHYTYEDYSGYGHVICFDTEKDSFFEVFGSHCSCYGLEGQWDPEYCTIDQMVHATKLRAEALKERGRPYSDDCEVPHLMAFLEIKE